jgi:predicted DsbA family dithiol-disulfide isomerase
MEKQPAGEMTKNDSVLHWYDFLCPFCYVGQSRTATVLRQGLDVIDLPFQVHPDIPANGVPVGPRVGEMYSHLEREAKEGAAPELASAPSKHAARFGPC